MSELSRLQDRVRAAKEKRITLVEQKRVAEEALAQAVEELELIGLTPETAAAEIEAATQELNELVDKIEESLK